MTTPPTRETPTPSTTRHRRETWLFIFLPMLGGGLLMVALLSLALVLPLRGQVSLVADFLLIIICLCPLVLCLFPVYLLLMVVALAMNKVHDVSAHQLKRVENASQTLADKTAQVTDTLNRTSIRFNALFAPLNRLWNIFDRPNSNGKKPAEENHVSTKTPQ